MALNIFGKSSWATKITSLLVEGEYTQYDSTDYLTANGANEWVIAEVYIGANCVIDIDCVIGNNVTINDGVVIQAGAVVEEGTNIMSGSVVS